MHSAVLGGERSDGGGVAWESGTRPLLVASLAAVLALTTLAQRVA